MNRRVALKSVASAVAGAGLMAMSVAAAGSEQKKNHTASPARSRFMPFIEATDGASLFCRQWGAGQPVVFVAPWGLSCDWWEYQMTHLAGHGLACIGYDRRGHGRSSEPGSGYDFDTLADDLKVVIDQLDLHDVTLVAQSLGAGEVVRYLSRHGAARVRRIVLIAPITPFLLKTADNPDGIDAGYVAVVQRALSKDRPGAIASAAPAFFGAPKNAISAEMMDWWRQLLLQCPLKVMVDLYGMFMKTDFREEVSKITAPTMIIHGDRDASTPIELTGRRTASLINGSQLKVYEDAAHGLPITHVERLNSDLLAFARS